MGPNARSNKRWEPPQNRPFWRVKYTIYGPLKWVGFGRVSNESFYVQSSGGKDVKMTILERCQNDRFRGGVKMTHFGGVPKWVILGPNPRSIKRWEPPQNRPFWRVKYTIYGPLKWVGFGRVSNESFYVQSSGGKDVKMTILERCQNDRFGGGVKMGQKREVSK